MLSRVLSFGLTGIEGRRISAEVDIAPGQVGVSVVGLGDAAVREAKSRIHPAIENSGYRFPYAKIVVSLVPASLKKEGAGYDLPMAVGILAAAGHLRPEALEGIAVVGELSLTGEVRRVPGVLPLLIAARSAGITRFIVPKANEAEAGYAEGIQVYPVATLSECMGFLAGKLSLAPAAPRAFTAERGRDGGEDFCYVRGQTAAKRAIEIAVSGGHNLLMIGPPGAGKTMLARCIPGIMPDLTYEEALEVTKIHSVAGILDGAEGIVRRRPFRSPHHTASAPALTGGGRDSRPGEISLAHHGVLFLDEMPEYSRHVLETLRQPLEDGVITVARANSTVEYPARFMLVASMNPCPCGNYGSAKRSCTCTPAEIKRYLAKLSAPLLDRIDLHVEADCVEYGDLAKGGGQAECSRDIRARVNAARALQRERYGGERFCTNDCMDSAAILRYCALDAQAESLLRRAFERLRLSARAYTRILKVARTIADMAGEADIRAPHVAEAVQYRTLDRKYWEE